MDADADGVGFHVAVADDEHGVDFRLLGVRDFGFDVVVLASSSARTWWARSSFEWRARIREASVVADGQDADLFGREPEREVAGVMFDEKADETLVCAERRAVNAERGLLGVSRSL